MRVLSAVSSIRCSRPCEDQAKLESCIDPYDPIEHVHSITNIVTGRMASEKVNAHKSVEIGREQMNKYAASWPDSFHSAIAKEVATMAVSRKSIRVGGIEVCDATLVYSRVAYWDCSQL